MLSRDEFRQTYSFLSKSSQSDAQTLIIYQYRWELIEKITNNWNLDLEKCSKITESVEQLAAFAKAIENIHSFYSFYLSINSLCENELKLELRSHLFHLISPQLTNLLNNIYKLVFQAFLNINEHNAALDQSMSDHCVACNKDSGECICEEIIIQFRAINKMLCELDLLDRLTSDHAVSIAEDTVQTKVQTCCENCFDISHLDSLIEWLHRSVYVWLDELYGVFSPDFSLNQSICGQQKERLQYLVHYSYAKSLINQLFSIVIDYPDSEPAIIDLKLCLERAELRRDLIETLRNDVVRRLLHPGVNTSEILLAYTQAVKSLRLLDTSGVIMDAVTSPIKTYLRNRLDTVRCIVSFLTDPKQMSLNAEMMNENSIIDTSECADDWSDFDEKINWKLWIPDPCDATQHSSSGRCHRLADIVSMLVGVYGSKELFVKEYRQLLCERLLKDGTKELEKEQRYLEILKVRFGESEMHQCEVMLKDIKDSERVDQFVKELDAPHFPINARIISAHFWPKLREESIQLPAYINRALEAYGSRFETHKASRRLEWRHQLGTVEMEMEMDGRCVNIECNTLHAAIIWCFQEKDRWSSDELCHELSIPPSLLRRRLAWWAGLGVVYASGGDWLLSSSLPNEQRVSSGHVMVEEEEDESGTEESDVQRLQQFWPYINQLLTNLDSLSPQRVHSLLKLFSSPGKPLVLETVKAFLQTKVDQQLLICTGGVYKLAKK